MDKIITLDKINYISRKHKKVVLVGGCFDIFHIGHLRFLEKAKKKGDILVVALESDAAVKRLKGHHKPIHKQKERSQILATINWVDYVLLLPDLRSDQDYFDLVMKIKPEIIAVTENDPIIEKKRQQARLGGGKLVVIPKINTPSTTRLAKLLAVD